MSTCSPWITGEDVQACCSVEATSGLIFDTVAEEASDLLFQLSGRKFPGECSKTVRPCSDDCGCNWQVLSRGFVVWPGMWAGSAYLDWGWGFWGCGGYDNCGCRPLSRVKLSGYPVNSITEVIINGDVLDPSEYRLDSNRYLTRLGDARWPGCQNLALDAGDSGTWTVEYSYGADPPELGRSAAAQLACELYKACAGQTCALPTGVTRESRQGVTIERLSFTSWAYLPASRIRGGRAPGWQTGMTLVDSFLNAYNPYGLPRRPVFWAPGRRRYAQGYGA